MAINTPIAINVAAAPGVFRLFRERGNRALCCDIARRAETFDRPAFGLCCRPYRIGRDRFQKMALGFLAHSPRQ
jgi:hypothetical protein